MLQATVIIADDGKASTLVDIGSHTTVGFIFPALVSCTITLQGCNTREGTFVNLWKPDASAAYTSGTTTGSNVLIYEDIPVRYLKVYSNNSQTGGPLTIEVVCK